MVLVLYFSTSMFISCVHTCMHACTHTHKYFYLSLSLLFFFPPTFSSFVAVYKSRKISNLHSWKIHSCSFRHIKNHSIMDCKLLFFIPPYGFIKSIMVFLNFKDILITHDLLRLWGNLKDFSQQK